jgi:hypothetical protein
MPHRFRAGGMALMRHLKEEETMVEGDIRTNAGARLTRRGVARLAAAALVAASMGTARLTAGVAAESVADCQARIEALRAATESATFSGRNAAKEQTGLLGKLDSASSKLAQGKFEDAIQSLTQFRDKVTTLQGQGKIDPDDANALIAGADDAIACVQSLRSR